MRPGTILYRGREILEPVLQLQRDGQRTGPDARGKDIKHFDLYEVRHGKIVREIEG